MDHGCFGMRMPINGRVNKCFETNAMTFGAVGKLLPKTRLRKTANSEPELVGTRIRSTAVYLLEFDHENSV